MPKPPPPLDPLPRMSVAELIEALREEAEDLADALPAMEVHEQFGAQAAQTLEEFAEALTRIAEGAPDPSGIAEAALRLDAPLKPLGNAGDTIRDLLRPKLI